MKSSMKGYGWIVGVLLAVTVGGAGAQCFIAAESTQARTRRYWSIRSGEPIRLRSHGVLQRVSERWEEKQRKAREQAKVREFFDGLAEKMRAGTLPRTPCARACHCGIGNGFGGDCSTFPAKISGLNCLAYSFNWTSLQCALLGDTIVDMCSEPVIVNVYSKCETAKNPQCGPITLDSTVICDSDRGYICKDGFIPYLTHFSNTAVQFTGGSEVQWNQATQLWSISTEINTVNFSYSEGQEITCKAVSLPRAPFPPFIVTCKLPILNNAVCKGRSCECLPGFTWAYYEKEGTKHTTTPLLCVAGGWSTETDTPGNVNVVQCEPFS